jgi:hypothetical protein
MSFAAWAEPSLDRRTLLRAGGAPGFVSASKLIRTAVTTRIVAVAWTVADTGCVAGAEVASAAAAAVTRRTIGVTANAFAAKW